MSLLQLSRVKAVEKEKDGLAHAKGEAMMFVRVERKVRSKKNVLYQMNMAEVRGEKEVTQAKLDAMKEKIDESKKEVEEAEARLKDIEESNQAEVEEKARLMAEEKKAKEAYAEFERRDIKMREDVKHAKTEVKRLKDKVAKEGKKAKAAEKKSKDASESVPKHEAGVAKAAASKEKEDAKLEKILDDVKGDTGRIREEVRAEPTKKMARKLEIRRTTLTLPLASARAQEQGARPRAGGEELVGGEARHGRHGEEPHRGCHLPHQVAARERRDGAREPRRVQVREGGGGQAGEGGP